MICCQQRFAAWLVVLGLITLSSASYRDKVMMSAKIHEQNHQRQQAMDNGRHPLISDPTSSHGLVKKQPDEKVSISKRSESIAQQRMKRHNVGELEKKIMDHFCHGAPWPYFVLSFPTNEHVRSIMGKVMESEEFALRSELFTVCDGVPVTFRLMQYARLSMLDPKLYSKVGVAMAYLQWTDEGIPRYIHNLAVIHHRMLQEGKFDSVMAPIFRQYLTAIEAALKVPTLFSNIMISLFRESPGAEEYVLCTHHLAFFLLMMKDSNTQLPPFDKVRAFINSAMPTDIARYGVMLDTLYWVQANGDLGMDVADVEMGFITKELLWDAFRSYVNTDPSMGNFRWRAGNALARHALRLGEGDIARRVFHEHLAYGQRLHNNEKAWFARTAKSLLDELGAEYNPADIDEPLDWDVFNSLNRTTIQDTFLYNGYVSIRHILKPGAIMAMGLYFKAMTNVGAKGIEGQSPGVHRMASHNDVFCRLLLFSMNALVNMASGEQLKPSYCYFSRYKEKSILNLHSDRPQCYISITFLIDYSSPKTNRPWPIRWHFLESGHHDDPMNIESQHTQLPGDGVIYRGEDLPHSRDELDAGGSSTHVFLHWIPLESTIKLD